MLKQDCTALGV